MKERRWYFQDGCPAGGTDEIHMWWQFTPAENDYYFIYPYNEQGFRLCYEDWTTQLVSDPPEELGWFDTLRSAKRAAEKHWAGIISKRTSAGLKL
jgi:hypothetical protein